MENFNSIAQIIWSWENMMRNLWVHIEIFGVYTIQFKTMLKISSESLQDITRVFVLAEKKYEK